MLARQVELSYADQTGTPPANSVSLLTRITVTGVDGISTQALPPLEFGYTAWDPAARRYQPLTVTAAELPATSLAGPGLDLVDLFGDGLAFDPAAQRRGPVLAQPRRRRASTRPQTSPTPLPA